MKIAVIGGGISGLATAAKLQSSGCDVRLFEKNERFGGLCKTDTIGSYVFDRHGGHVFNSKHPEVKKWVFDLLPEENWQFSSRVGRIEFDGNFISYPFELSLSELPHKDATQCILDFLACSRKPESKPQDFRNWLYWMFGKGIADRYLVPYNEKIWNRDLSEISICWVDGKMPLPSDEDLVMSILDPQFKEKNMPHSTFYYPKCGGIQVLIDAIESQVSNKVASYTIEKVEIRGDSYLVDGESFDHVISTIPLPELAKIVVDLPIQVRTAIERLQFNSITTALFKYEKSKVSWVYYPSKDKGAHRMVCQGNLSDELPGCVALEKTGTWEVSDLTKGFDEISPSDFIAKSWTHYGYPVYDLSFEANMAIITDYFREMDIGLVGRFAEWKYYNMDTCIKAGFDYCDALLSKVATP